jgi:hypothetical protein
MPQVAVHRDFKVVTDGITLQTKLSAPPGTQTAHIEDKITLLERYIQAPNQISMEFEKQTILTGVEITVADKPKTNDREFEFRIKVTGASMIDRSTIYALSQSKSKVTLKVVELDSGKKKETAKAEGKPAEQVPDPAKKVEPKELSTVDKALLIALGADKCNCQTGLPIEDDQLLAALNIGWKDPINGSTDDGFCFVAIGASGRNKQPRLHIAEQPQTPAAVNGKPAIQGAALIARVRELLNIPKPEKARKGKGA